MGRGRDFRGGGSGRKRQAFDEDQTLPDLLSIQSTNPSHQRSASSAARPGRVEAGLSEAKEVFGKVKWFSAEKGMGFVEAEDGGKDVFIHVSVVKRAGMTDLAEGRRMSMRVTQTAKGRQAVSVAVID
jgi:cold shock CspA family protein